MNTDSILAEIKRDYAVSAEATFNNDLLRAALLSRARVECFGGNCKKTIAWCRENLVGCGRGEFFRMRRCEIIYKELTGIVRARTHLVPHDFGKLDDLSTIRIGPSPKSAFDFGKIFDLIQSHDVAAMDREDLRALITKYRVPPKKTQQLDFFHQLDLPAPEQVKKQLLSAETNFDPNLAANYGTAFYQGALRHMSRLKPEILEDIVASLKFFTNKIGVFQNARHPGG